MLNNLRNQSPLTVNVNQSTAYSEGVSLDFVSTLGVQCVIDVPSAVVFASASIDATANTFTKAGAVLWTGVKGQFTTSNTLPTGITALTNYWAILVDLNAGIYKFATSLNNALAGTAVDISTAGTGNQTFTPTALSGGTISFQRTNIITDHALTTVAGNWDDIETATAVTADAHVWFTKIGPEYAGFRVKGVASDGAFQIKAYVRGRGENKK